MYTGSADHDACNRAYLAAPIVDERVDVEVRASAGMDMICDTHDGSFLAAQQRRIAVKGRA